jgi:arylsulfatase A-like enzyme
MAFRRDYEITIKADMSDMPYWTCLRKGERTSNLTLEDYKALLEMVDDVSKRIYNHIKRLQEIENSD